jgi:bifunctional isochorismate lyase/aryl carrier protein
MRAALAIIDMQAWMFRERSNAARLPRLTADVNAIAAAFAACDCTVYDVRTVWTRDPATWTLRCRRSNEPKLLEGTSDVEAVPGLALPPGTLRLDKQRNSAFVMTDFHRRLRSAGISRLFLTGCFDEACIGFTAIDAYERNIEPIIVADAVAEGDADLAHCMHRLTDMVGDIRRVSFADATRMIDAR